MSVQPSDKLQVAKGAFKSFVSSAGAAAKLIAAKAEQTKLTTLTLPAAYRELGKDCVQNKRHLQGNEPLVEQLQSVLAESRGLKEAASNQPAPTSLTDKAKAAGKQAADVARQKSLSMKRDSLLVELGQAIYQQHEEASGSQELVKPIQDALARLAALEEQVRSLSAVGSGSWITPKRLIVAVVVLVALGAIGRWRLGASHSENRNTELQLADTFPSNQQDKFEESGTTNKPSVEDSSPRLSGAVNRSNDDKPLSAAHLTLSVEQKQAVEEIQRFRGRVFDISQSANEPQLAVHFPNKSSNLGGVQIRGQDLKCLIPLKALLTELNLENAPITDFSLVEQLTNLRVIYIHEVSKGASLISLTRLPNLESLSIRWVRFAKEDSAMKEAIVGCKTLKHLQILGNLSSLTKRTNNRIDWLPPIAGRLKYLELPSYDFTEEEIQTIATCPQIETLVLMNGVNEKSPSKRVRGFDQLNKCETLRVLSMGTIDDALMKVALHFKKLKTFHAFNNSLSDSMWIALDNRADRDVEILLTRPNTAKKDQDKRPLWHWWFQQVPATHERNPLASNARKSSPQTIGKKSPDDSLPATDMNERFDALVFRIRLGMTRTQVEDILGIPDESVENDLGDFNPQKAGQILEICTWKGDTEDEGFIMLSFLNGKLQDGGTPGFDVGKGFKMKVPANIDPQRRANLEKAMKTFGVRIVDE